MWRMNRFILSALIPAPAIQTRDVRCHWLIRTSGLHLIIGTFLWPTLGFPAYKVVTGRFGVRLVHPIRHHCGLSNDWIPFILVKLGDWLSFKHTCVERWICKHANHIIACYIAHHRTHIRIIQENKCFISPTRRNLGICGRAKSMVIHSNLNVRT